MAIEHKNPTGSRRDITPDMLIDYMGGEGNVSLDDLANRVANHVVFFCEHQGFSLESGNAKAVGV